mmetsp:Transcript_1399/g.1875  ORF Transcript_1399/g.1875 Transcript_1399/m.1875 type:complete len:88 (+) Transcript_1399:79-342(+)
MLCIMKVKLSLETKQKELSRTVESPISFAKSTNSAPSSQIHEQHNLLFQHIHRLYLKHIHNSQAIENRVQIHLSQTQVQIKQIQQKH